MQRLQYIAVWLFVAYEWSWAGYYWGGSTGAVTFFSILAGAYAFIRWSKAKGQPWRRLGLGLQILIWALAWFFTWSYQSRWGAVFFGILLIGLSVEHFLDIRRRWEDD